MKNIDMGTPLLSITYRASLTPQALLASVASQALGALQAPRMSGMPQVPQVLQVLGVLLFNATSSPHCERTIDRFQPTVYELHPTR